MNVVLKKSIPFIFAISLLILGLAVGFFIGKRTQASVSVSTNLPINTNTTDNSLYSSQTATIRGEITKVDGETLTIKNLNNQTTGQQQVSSRILITKATARPDRTASPSSDLSKIELNKEALINLEMIGGRYQIISIQYILPTPSLPPITAQ